MPSLTITTTVVQAQRLAAAVGAWQGLERSATDIEIKAFIISQLSNIVLSYERKVLEDAAKASIAAPTSFIPT